MPACDFRQANINAIIKIASDFDSYTKSLDNIVKGPATPGLWQVLKQSIKGGDAFDPYWNQLRDQYVQLNDTPSNYGRIPVSEQAFIKYMNDFKNKKSNAEQALLRRRVKAYLGTAGQQILNTAVRGGAGAVADAFLNNHKGGYGVVDAVTSGSGGIAGGMLGSYIAQKFAGGNGLLSAAGNIVGSSIGGLLLNKLRQYLTQ